MSKQRARDWSVFFQRALDLPEVRDVADAILVADQAVLECPEGPQFSVVESPPPEVVVNGSKLSVEDAQGNLHSEKNGQFEPKQGTKRKYRLSSSVHKIPTHWKYGDEEDVSAEEGFQVWNDFASAIAATTFDTVDGDYTVDAGYNHFLIVDSTKSKPFAGGNFWSSVSPNNVDTVRIVDAEKLSKFLRSQIASDNWQSLSEWIDANNTEVNNWLAENSKIVDPEFYVPDFAENEENDTFFSHDIENPLAQSVLDRAVAASRRLSQRARRDLELVLLQPDQEIPGALAEWLRRYREQLTDILSTTQLAALLEGAREVARDIPQVPMLGGAPIPPALGPQEAQSLVERVSALPEGVQRDVAIYGLPPEQQVFVRQALAQGGPPAAEAFAPQVAGDADRVQFAVIDEAARILRGKNVVSPESFAALDAAARQKALAVAGAESLDAVQKVREALADVVQEGADYEAFRAKVLEAVDAGTFLSEPHMETVFRTVVQSAFSDGQMHVLQQPFVRGGFPYAVYEAIHDDRVRPDHIALEKLGIGGSNVYRINDPVFQLFRPPWDFCDRCSWYPITVRQAAERGVAEAVDWLRVGLEPQPPAFVAMPPFRPPASFQRSLAGAQLSLSLLPDAPVVRAADADRIAAQLAAIESVATMSQRVERIGDLLASDAETKHAVLEEFVLAVKSAEEYGRQSSAQREAAVRQMLDDVERREASLREQRVADEASLAALHEKHLAEIEAERKQVAEVMARERRSISKIFDAGAEAAARAAEFPVLVNVQVDPTMPAPAPIQAAPEPRVVSRRVAVRKDASGEWVGEVVQESADALSEASKVVRTVRVRRDVSGEWVGEIN